MANRINKMMSNFQKKCYNLKNYFSSLFKQQHKTFFCACVPLYLLACPSPMLPKGLNVEYENDF